MSNLGFIFLFLLAPGIFCSNQALTALTSFIDDNFLNTDAYLKDEEVYKLVNFMLKERE